MTALIPIDFIDGRTAIGEVRVAGQTLQVFPTREFQNRFNDIVRRLGGPREDLPRDANNAGETALAWAKGAGLSAAYGVLTPAYPLSYTATSDTLATITIANHTRVGATSAIVGGTLTGKTRGSAYYVYYDDATDAGGSVSFASSTSEANVAAATYPNRRVVGVIYLDNPPASTSGMA